MVQEMVGSKGAGRRDTTARRRKVAVLAGVGALSLAMGACGGGADAGGADGSTFKVQIVADVTGPTAALSAGEVGALTTVFESVNADGGIDGMEIEFEVFDAHSTPAGAQSALQRAVSEGADVLALSLLSSSISGLMPTLQAAEVPTFTLAAPPELVAPGDAAEPWLYSIAQYLPSVASVASGASELLIDGLEGKTVAWIGLDSPGTNIVADSAIELIESEGATISADQRTPLSITSFASQASNIARTNPDVVFSIQTGANAAVIVPALRVAGFDGPVIDIGSSASDDVLLEKLKDDGYYSVRSYRPPEPGDEMSAQAEERGQGDTTNLQNFAHGWVKAHAIVNGLKECAPDCDTDSFVEGLDALGELDIPGNATFTPTTFSPDKHYSSDSSQLHTWDPDKGAVVEIGEPIRMAVQ